MASINTGETKDETKVVNSSSSDEADGTTSSIDASSGDGTSTSDGDGEESNSEVGEAVETTDEDEDEVDAETLALARLLQNPETKQLVIAALQKDVKTSVESGKTQAEAIKSSQEVLRKHFGDDWAFLADKMAPIFDYMFSQMAELNTKLTASEQRRIEQSSNQAAEAFYGKHPDARPFEKQIIALMNKYDPAPGVDNIEYLEDLYKIARAGKPVQTQQALANKATQRITRNSTDVRAGSSGIRSATEAPRKMSLNESVADALSKLQKS